jgi:inosine triphosphate pyrophosphatase
MPAVVNFITGNANKLGEVKAILEPAITVRSQAVDIEEVQGTVEEVTLAKCRKAAEIVSFLLPLVYS